ncbi:MAG: hypothetical protein QXG33_03760 [Candidatus Anstonellales archaeon]
MPNLLFCAKYPFTREAKEYVKGAGVSLDTDILRRAEKRVVSAIQEGKIPPFSEVLPSTYPIEIFSYAAARMIISGMKSRYFISRYAIAESKRSSEYLRKDPEENLKKIMDELKIFCSYSQDNTLMPLFAYLKYSPKDTHYKLSKMKIKGGFVIFEHDEKNKLIRITEEAIRKSIESSLPVVSPTPPEVKRIAQRLSQELSHPKPPKTTIGSENIPPCIRELLDRLALSENLPHTARWVLAVYLLNSGMSPENVINAFRTAPDYSEETTKYQVTHIKEKKYSMPSCATMDTYGLCNATCGCLNPLRYRKGMELQKGQAAESEKKK